MSCRLSHQTVSFIETTVTDRFCGFCYATVFGRKARNTMNERKCSSEGGGGRKRERKKKKERERERVCVCGGGGGGVLVKPVCQLSLDTDRQISLNQTKLDEEVF